ncbi:MAG: hypothetical protein RL514_2699 [Verrucomicrobiota bacterium]
MDAGAAQLGGLPRGALAPGDFLEGLVGQGVLQSGAFEHSGLGKRLGIGREQLFHPLANPPFGHGWDAAWMNGPGVHGVTQSWNHSFAKTMRAFFATASLALSTLTVASKPSCAVAEG